MSHIFVFLVNSISGAGRRPLFLFDIHRVSVLINVYRKRIQVVESPKGNLVEIEDGHAAVSGDETCHNHCPELVEGWEGARRP